MNESEPISGRVSEREIRAALVASRLELMAQELRAIVGPEMHASFGVNSSGVSLGIHGCKTYQSAVGLLRSIGVGRWHKDPMADELSGPEGRTVLHASIGNIELTVFANSLPPSCRLETFTEKIPKAQTVTTDEFIEVQRTKVVCGEPDSDRKAIVDAMNDVPALAGMAKEGDQ